MRTRARRGRERLRAELDRRDFDWRPALVAFSGSAARPELALPTAASIWTMKTTTVALLVSAVALATLAVHLTRPERGISEHGLVPREALAAGRPNRQRSGLDGSFAMAGLRTDRSYRLRAWNEETLQAFVSAPIDAPETDCVFTLPLGDVHAGVHGVVIGTDGAPLDGVRIRLTMVVDEREIDGVVQSNEMHTGQTVTTGEDGRFTFHDVPHTRVFLRFHGADVVARPYDVRADSPVEDLRIVLPRQVRFELARDPTSTLAPDAFEVWDQLGAPIAVKQSGAYPPPGRVLLESLETATYRCGDDARWLVLYDDAREVARLELRIRPGETVPIRY